MAEVTTHASFFRRVTSFVMRHRIAVLGVLLLYGITWRVGATQVRSQIRREALAARDAYYHGHPDGDEWPEVEFPYTLPLLPGVIVCSNEVTIAPLMGQGQVSFFWIFARRPIRIYDYGIWIS